MFLRLILLLLFITPQALAGKHMLVEKKEFTMDSYTTFFGEEIKDLRVGWESYGTLNADKSNAILVTHYFSGNSHAAGVYTEDDEEPGYWDAVIGPGKAIDTNRFFVISVDSLVNLSAYDEHVITTGPASINPDTQKPYGLSFPVVTMRDFVNVQRAVIRSLGIKTLYAVAGTSMGSMQAIDWASAYPDEVERMISVLGSAGIDSWTSSLLDQWTWPIKLDPAWKEGNYYNNEMTDYPIKGITQALALITQVALHPEFFNQMGEQLPKDDKTTLASSVTNDPEIVKWLMDRASMRAANMDANHLLYMVRANQLFLTGMQENLTEGLKSITAKTLFVTGVTDLLLMPYQAELAYKEMKALDKNTQLYYIKGPLGHLEGVAGIEKASQLIADFLQE
ncbi:MAG: homoserine O-acetyltransferase [Pseudomonadota bacterium]